MRSARIFGSLILAGLITLTACGTESSSTGSGGAGSLALPVDATVTPAQPKIGDRPLGRMVSESGTTTDFFLGELVVVSDDRAKVEAFAARWGGTITQSTGRVDKTAAIHHVKLDPTSADVARLLGDLNGKLPDLKGKFRVSSDAAAKLLAVALAEANAGGMTVMPNFALAQQAIADGHTTEAATGEDGLYTPNAFDWPYMSRGSAQDIGVGAAWQAMARAGVLDNKVKIMILDGGFSPNVDFPDAKLVIGTWNEPNPGSCGGNPCPWHATMVTSAAMGRADDGHGSAGPAAPVGQLIAVPFQLSFFELLSTIERIFAGTAATDILNVSSAFDIDIGWDIAAKIACLGLCPSPTEVAGALTATIAASNKLFFASAGNQGRDVDGASNPEGSTTLPCELPGVICVGGMAHNSTSRDEGSNFGSRDEDSSVDIYGPYSVWVGPDPDAPSDSNARLKHGTSFSSPFVAGVAALVWASNPRQSASDVWGVLKSTAHVGGVHPNGGSQRRINAFGAVASVLGGAAPTVSLTTLAETATMNREWSATAVVNDDGALCAPPRCPIEWTPTPSRVVGNTAFYRFETAGTQTVSARVMDPVGQEATASRPVEVTNAPPVVVLSTPAAGATIFRGVFTQFLAAATDENEGPDPGPGPVTCTWTSSHISDGTFPAAGCNISRSFIVEGARTITVTATDTQGQTTTASVNVTVVPPPTNLPPVVTLSTTFPATTYDKGYPWTEARSLSATAADPESNNPITWEWRATSFQPNSTTTVYASDVPLGTSSSLTWTPSSTPALLGDFGALGNACYNGQVVRISVRAKDSLGNASAWSVLPDIRLYRCILG